MMIDDEAIGLAVEILDEVWFYNEAHRKIYQAVTDLYQSRKNVDLITLSDKLKGEGALEEIGGVSYLSAIIDFVPTSANVEHYAQIVKEKGVLRQLIKNATHIITDAYDAKENIDDVVDNAERLIFEIADVRQKQKASHIKDLVKSSIENIRSIVINVKNILLDYQQGFTKFDHMTSGFAAF